MDINKVKNALQDLIIRLQDAETGYKEIEMNTNNLVLKEWMKKNASERHGMHKQLENHMMALGGVPEVKTSVLGEIHKLFIDIKLNSFFDNFDSIVTEIKRGSNKLLDEYNEVLKVDMPMDILQTLLNQKGKIINELDTIVELNEKLNAVEA